MKGLISEAFRALQMAIVNIVSFLSSAMRHKLFWILGGVAIGVVISGVAFQRTRRRRSSLLSAEVKKEIARISKSGPSRWFKRLFDHVYMPSGKSLLTVFAILLPFLVISHLSCVNIFPESIQVDVSTFVSILTAMGVIVFALLVFVAEGMRESRTSDRGRVLLRESLLFPLFVAEVVMLLSFLIGPINMWAMIPVFGIGFLLVYSLYRMMAVLLSKSQFADKRIQVLTDRVKKSMSLAMEERIGNNRLVEYLNQDEVLLEHGFYRFDEENEDEYVRFVAPISGRVSDIRFDRLKEFCDLAEREANKKGYSFLANKRMAVTKADSQGESATTSEEPNNYTKIHTPLLMKTLGDTVDSGEALLSVDKRAVDDNRVFRRMERIASSCILLDKRRSYSEEMTQELEAMNDDFLTAISEGKLGSIKDLKKAYIRIAESFLDMFTEIGGVYSHQDARKERAAILGGWNETQWLRDAVFGVVQKAIRSDDLGVVAEVAYLPIAIVIRAFRAKDHFLFQEFILFPSFLYDDARSARSQAARAFLFDRSWRHICDVAQYYVEPELRKLPSSSRETDSLQAFAVEILLVFQRLLKQSTDENDFESFSVFLEKYGKLYDRFLSDRYLSRNRQFIDKAQGAAEKLREQLTRRKQQVIFGLASWALEKSRTVSESSTRIESCVRLLVDKLPQGVTELTELFLDVRSHDVVDYWGWSTWNMAFDGEVHSYDPFGRMDVLYCILSLRILENMSDGVLERTKLPSERDFTHLVEQEGHLTKVLLELIAKPDEWSSFLSEEAIAKAESLRALFDKAVQEQKREESEYLVKATLSTSRIEQFKKNLQDRYAACGVLRPIFKEYGMLIDKSGTDEIPPDLNMYGFNQIVDKGAFLDSWYVSYSRWGEQYGEALATSQDQIVFKSLVDKIRPQSDVDSEELDSLILAELEKGKYSNPILLTNLQFHHWHELTRKSKRIVEVWNPSRQKTHWDTYNGYQGYLVAKTKRVPIFDLRVTHEDVRDCVVLISMSGIGKWEQYPPIWKQKDKRHQIGAFMMRIEDLNQADDLRERVIENSDWAKKYKDDDTYLRQKAVVMVYEKYRFSVSDESAGCVFRLRSDNMSGNQS